MSFLLNIGLKSATLGDIEANTALAAVSRAGVFVWASAVHESDTEPTLVVSGHWQGPEGQGDAAVERLARELGQDCIAVYDEADDNGALYGPKPWGDCNPEFFLTLAGTRLAQPVAA